MAWKVVERSVKNKKVGFRERKHIKAQLVLFDAQAFTQLNPIKFNWAK